MKLLEEQEVQVGSLAGELDRLYAILVQAAKDLESLRPQQAIQPRQVEPCRPLERITQVLGLSTFERDTLLLCAGAALEPRFLSACAAAQHDSRATAPTFGLALSILQDAHWSAISRARPLRYWRLIEVDDTQPIHAPLRIDTSILQYLLEVPALDERLEGLVRGIGWNAAVGATEYFNGGEQTQSQAIQMAVQHWRSIQTAREPILLIGNQASTLETAFLTICRETELLPYEMDANDAPVGAAEREQLVRLWTRDSVLRGAALYLRTEGLENSRNLAAFVHQLGTPVAIQVQAGSPVERIEGLRIHPRALSTQERSDAWRQELGPIAHQMNGQFERLVDHFRFDFKGIQRTAAIAREQSSATLDEKIEDLTWSICRQHARRSLENMAQRLETPGTWEDIVLPSQQMQTLQQIAVHVRQRGKVNDDWGFASRYQRGLGLSAVFSGASGTGKTMAAETIASVLNLDVYRIDLAGVVSKYIGETEKNLRKIFDAAEESCAILLFDEADALFGKRSEVKDSHDRYANLEVSYLLQRVESYRGVAILTTNMQHALDPAFVRRIRFIVQFPFPDFSSRVRIWQGIFPAAAPVDKLDYNRLGQLNVSGGVIRNIATHAAYLAAEGQAPINMNHLGLAARTEYSKMDKPLTEAETRGWA